MLVERPGETVRVKYLIQDHRTVTQLCLESYHENDERNRTSYLAHSIRALEAAVS